MTVKRAGLYKGLHLSTNGNVNPIKSRLHPPKKHSVQVGVRNLRLISARRQFSMKNFASGLITATFLKNRTR
jgi:hypothetical protein